MKPILFAYSLHAAILLALLALTGCDGSHARVDAYEQGRITLGVPVRPDIRFDPPSKRIRVKVGKKFDCGYTVGLPEEGSQPTHVNLNICDNDKIVGLAESVSLASSDQTLNFHSRARAPQKPGLYRLRVDATYYFTKKGDGEKVVGKKEPIERMAFSGFGPEVEVVP